MKVGDRLYCKKDVPYSFAIGRIYIISDVDDILAVVDSDCSFKGYFYKVKSADRTGISWINIGPHITQLGPCIQEYFYSEREFRKLKLERLNERMD